MRSFLDAATRESKMLSWAFGGLWVFVTAFLWSPSRDGLEGVYALAFFIPMLLVLPWRKPDMQQYGGVFTFSALGYASWATLTSVWGSDTGFFVLQWLVLATWLAGSAWVLQQRAMQNQQLELETLLRWLLIIGSLTALVSIVVFYRDHPLIHRLEGVGVARAPTLVGQVYGVVVLIAILQSWRTDCFKCAVLLSLASLPALAAMGLSQSRGPLLSLVLALVIALLWLRPAWKIVLSQALAAMVILLVLMLMLPVEQLVMERGASMRGQIWLHVWQSMSSEPLSFFWGIGMSKATKIVTAVGEYHHAHNAWLDIIYRSGVIGLGLALFHLLWLLRAVRHQRQLAPLALWLIYGSGCVLLDARSLFWEIDAKWLMYWIPAGLLAASLCPRKSMPAQHSAGIGASDLPAVARATATGGGVAGAVVVCCATARYRVKRCAECDRSRASHEHTRSLQCMHVARSAPRLSFSSEFLHALPALIARDLSYRDSP